MDNLPTATTRPRPWAVLAALLATLLAPAVPATAGVIERVSVATDGAEADARSRSPAMSTDGLTVVFVSEATNLVAGDTNNTLDVFLRDRVTGATSRVNVASDGSQANGASVFATVSANGRYVLFSSQATNLAPGYRIDGGLYLHDRNTSKTEPVTVRRINGQDWVVRGSWPATVSNDGRYVGFTGAGYLADQDTDNDGHCDQNCDTNGYNDALVRDRQAGRYIRASVGANGEEGDFHSRFEDMTPDGRLVVFTSEATNLVAGDTNNARDVFLRDLVSNTTILVSRTPAGTPGNGDSGGGAISADGRFIAFTSDADDLVAGDTNGQTDVFVFDRLTNTVTRVSLASDGSEATNGMSYYPDISADGRFVSFVSQADNLAPLNPIYFNRTHVYVHDRLTGLTTRMSAAMDGSEAAASSGQYPPVISGDGQLVVFDSVADNLVAGDTNGVTDIFIAANQRIDLVQAVVNRVPPGDNKPGYALVAGKDLVARVYASLPPSDPPTAVQGRLCVDHPVDQCPADHLFTATGTLYPSGHVFTDDERRQATHSINFFITGSRANTLLTPGDHSFAVAISAPVGDLSVGTITGQVAGNFRQSQSLAIFVYPIQLTDKNNNQVLPDAAMLPKAADFIRATYPVDEEQVTNRVQPALPFGGLPIAQTGNANQDAATLNMAHLRLTRTVARRFLLDRLLLAAVQPLAANTFGAGVVANLINGSNAIGTPGSSGLMGFTYPSIKGVVITLDRVPKAAPANHPLIGSTLAHEMGHQLRFGDEYCFDSDNDDVLESPCRVDNNTYSKNNPPPQSKEEGGETGNHILEPMGAFDVGGFLPNRRALFGPPGTPLFSYMGAGNDTNSWTSQTEYEFLYPRLTTPAPPAPTPRRIIALTGVLGADDSLQLDPPMVVPSTAPLEPPPATSDYHLNFLDSAGATLGSQPLDIDFTLEYLAEGDAGHQEVDAIPLVVSAELPDGTTTLTITHNTAILGQVQQSPHPPVVQINKITVTAGMVTVSWAASDPDNAPLTFALLYEENGPLSRQALGYDLTTTSFTFPLSELAHATTASFLEVVANDGFNTASDRAKVMVRRGDLNGDDKVDLADAVLGLRYLAGLPTPVPLLALPFADVNGNGLPDLAEVTYALNFAAFAGQLSAEISGSPLVGETVEILIKNAVIGPLQTQVMDPQIARIIGKASPLSLLGLAPGSTTVVITDQSGTTIQLPIIVQ